MEKKERIEGGKMSEVDELKTAGKGKSEEDGFFTPTQQGKVQELIDSAYKKAYDKASKNLSGNEEIGVLKKELDSLKEERKSNSILRALSRHNVIDGDEVTELMKRHVLMDGDGSFCVKDDSAFGTGQKISVNEFVDKWLVERPHHLKFDSHGTGGSGSRSSFFNEEKKSHYNLSDPNSWRNMPRDDFERLLKEGVNVQGTSGQTYKFKNLKNPFYEKRKNREK